MGKVYTKSGDGGFTTMACGKVVLKDEKCIELVGTIDEVLAFLGIAKLSATKSFAFDIEFIQQKLIYLMGKISKEDPIETEEIKILEKMCDRYSSKKINDFIMLDKNPLSAKLNYARAIVRRAERVACALCKEKEGAKSVIAYLNRLSDLLFSMARNSLNK